MVILRVGTKAAAEAYLAHFDQEYERLSTAVQAKVGAAKPLVVAQLFATPWVYFAGLEPAGTYGPMPMTPAELKTLTDAKPQFVFENVHMGSGDPVVEATGATKIDLLNFPFQVSIEEFAAAQPDVIIIGTYPGQEAEPSIAFLQATFPNVPAVQNNRLYPVPTVETEASARIIDGFEKVARAIHPEAFEE